VTSQSVNFASSLACAFPRIPQPMMAALILEFGDAADFESEADSARGMGAETLKAAAVMRESSKKRRRVIDFIRGKVGYLFSSAAL
jgi:hypothetical protein